MTTGVRVAALAICSLLIAGKPAEPAEPPLHGVYQSDCSPNDGEAFIIMLPTQTPQEEFWLRANAPVRRIVGHWPHTKDFGTQSGVASIVLCRKTPRLTCERPEAGFFDVTGKPGGGISGAFEASFGDGVRHKHDFSAVPARLAEPVVCG
jgi:hypothetical protein